MKRSQWVYLLLEGVWHSLVVISFLMAIPGSGQASDSESGAPPDRVEAWRRWEHTLASRRVYKIPYADITLQATYTGPKNRTLRAHGFWDGGNDFRLRTAFPAPGTRHWETTCSDTTNAGLHHQRGTVEVQPYRGDHLLYRHGFLKVSDNHRHLVYGDGTPFLWMGDTALSAPMRASDAEWGKCLADSTSPARAKAPTKKAAGPLSVHPTNPRYFTDGTKNQDGSLKVVYLTGSHTWNSLQDGAFFTKINADPPPTFDFKAYLDFLERNNHNFIRLWRMELPKFHYWPDTDASKLRAKSSRPGIQFSQPHPWARTGPGKALDGKPKFDLNKFDPAYFNRLRSRVIAARDRGIYVSVMLFEGGELRGTNKPWCWSSHPFNGRNNINKVEADVNGDGMGIEFHTQQSPEVAEFQKKYICHVVDAVNDLDNVLYEVGNEMAYSPANTKFQYWVIDTIKKYEAKKPKRHPVGMVCPMHYPWRDGVRNDPRNASLLDGPADWVSPGHRGGRGYGDNATPPATDGKKVILLDTDHLWGIGGNHAWVWKSFLRGHNPLFMDVLPEITEHTLKYPQAPEIRTALGRSRSVADKVNLAAMAPRGDLASTRYCLANPGKEYLVYLPEGGKATVDLSAVKGMLAVEWFNPHTGASIRGGTIEGGTKQVVLTAPFKGDGIVHLKAERREKR